MLSTAHARSLFERLSSCLAEIGAMAKDDADTAVVAASLQKISTIMRDFETGLASPHSTWQKLLQHKVRQTTAVVHGRQFCQSIHTCRVNRLFPASWDTDCALCP